MSKRAMLPRLKPRGEVGAVHLRTLLLLVPATLAVLSWCTVSFVPLTDYLPTKSLVFFGQAGRSAVYDLLNDELYIPSGGESLLHKQTRKDGPWSISLPTEAPIANAPFYITINCDASIVGQAACAPQYEVHLRGPIAWTVSPDPLLYTHDAQTGTTRVRVVLPQAGVYEVWAWPDWEAVGACPMRQEGPWGVQPVVKGSGGTVAVARDARGGARDDMRACDDAMYRQGEVDGRWLSVGHIREKYRGLEWARAHISKAEARSTGYPDYVYVPYTCKRAPLDYARALDETGDLTHLAYVGDSILRMSYCGHLFRALHGGEATGMCAYSEDLGKYHYADRSFTYAMPGRAEDVNGDVRLSQRFVNNDVARSIREHVNSLAAEDRPVSHLIVNAGMWLTALNMDAYVEIVAFLLEQLVERVGSDAKFVWINTPAVSAGLFCWDKLKRGQIEMHSFWAAVAIGRLKKRYPGLWIVQVDAFGITDARPETTSDGRHWVRESDQPALEDRPFVGRADDAIMEWAYDAFRASWLESQSRLGGS